MKTLLSKLKEPSTIRGIAIIGSVAGLSLDPSKWDAIGAALAAIIGRIEISLCVKTDYGTFCYTPEFSKTLHDK